MANYPLPIAAWLFDEGSGSTAAEYYGSTTLNIVLSNAALGANGLDFSGSTSDYAYIAAANNVPLRVSAPFSIVAGIRLGPSNLDQQIFHSANDTSVYSGYHFRTNSSGNIELMYGDGAGANSNNRCAAIGGTVLSANNSHAVAAIVNSTNGGNTGIDLFVNGGKEAVSWSGGGTSMVHANSNSILGRWNIWAIDSNLTIRYLFIYDRALTQQEISAIHTDYAAALGGIEATAPTAALTIASSGVNFPSGALSYPRHKMAINPANADQLWAIYGNGSGAGTYAGSYRGNAWAPLGANVWDYHASLYRDSHGFLHVGSRNGADGVAIYRRYTDAWQATVQFDDYSGSGGTAHVIPAATGNDVIAIVRSNFGYAPYTIFWHRSTDNGATWGSANTLVQPNASVWHRIGGLYLNGAPAASVWDTYATYCTIRLYRWAGSAFAAIANNDLQTTSADVLTRQYTVIEAGDGEIHAVWRDILAGPTHVLRHSHRPLAGAWSAAETIATVAATDRISPILTSHGASVHLIYNRNSGTYDAIMHRAWTSSGGWGAETELSTPADGDCGDPSTCYSVPVIFDYIPVLYTQDAGDLLKYVAIEAAPAGAAVNLVGGITGVSATPDLSANIARALLAAISGQAVTPDLSATLTNVVALVASISGSSMTPDLAAAIARDLSAAVGGQSTAPDLAAAITRSLSAGIVGIAATPDLPANMQRLLSASIQGAGVTPDISAATIRALGASIAATNTAPDLSAVISRSLLAAISGQSSVPDLSVLVEGIVNLTASVVGVSSTPDIVATSARQLSAGIAGQGTAPDLSAAVARSLLATIAAASGTPDLDGVLTNVVALAAAVRGVSITADLSATIARDLSAHVMGATDAPDMYAAVQRSLSANVQGISFAPDNIKVLMGEILPIVTFTADPIRFAFKSGGIAR
jgi:hypothetical protein